MNFFLMYTLCITHLVSAALGLLFLNVHGQHLAAEREALSLLNHLLVRRYGVVPHDHMALEEWIMPIITIMPITFSLAGMLFYNEQPEVSHRSYSFLL